MLAVGYSNFLGTPEEVLNNKYFDFETGLFTKEINIRSAIFLYFVDVFGINLASVNRINPYTGQMVTLDEIFSIINLQDVDIQQKVWKLYQTYIPNEFLGDDIYKLAEQYKLVELFPNAPIKRLVKR